MQVETTGAYRYGYRLGIGNPRPTRTCETGMAGFVGIGSTLAYLHFLNMEANIGQQTQVADLLTVQYLWC